MDFAKCTAEDVLAEFTREENKKWEAKSAKLLENKEKLKLELAVQLSAFANSNGGFVAFGIDQTTGTFTLEACPQTKGGQSMKDYLGNIIDRCTEPPISNYHVHPIPSADGSFRIYVVEIEDSPSAPHQNVYDKVYYKRLDTKSVGAEDFYVKLLRDRFTKAILKPTFLQWGIQSVRQDPNIIQLTFDFELENISHALAERWSLYMKDLRPKIEWRVDGSAHTLRQGATTLPPVRPEILPFEKRNHSVILIARPETWTFLIEAFEEIRFQVRAVSHNHAGEPLILDWESDDRQRSLAREMRDKLVEEWKIPDSRIR